MLTLLRGSCHNKHTVLIVIQSRTSLLITARAVARFFGFGGEKYIFRGQDFCFIICLKQIFLGTKNFGGKQKSWGALSPTPPVATGLITDLENTLHFCLFSTSLL